MTQNGHVGRMVELAKAHAQDFATRAAQHDREATYPFENFEAMRKSGYHALTVPEELGGMGANIEELCLAQFHLAQGCGATAMAANMHLSVVGRRADNWRKTKDRGTEEALLRVVEEGVIACGINSDVTSGGDPRYTGAIASRVEGGFRLTAMYAFATNSVGATNLDFMFNAPTGNGHVELFSASMPKATEGITVLNDWDPMGMRATGSNSVRMKEVFIPDSKITRSREPGQLTPGSLNAHAWFAPSVTAVCVGIAQAALDCAIAETRGRKRTPHVRTMEHFPGSQFAIAESYIELQAATALLEKTTHGFSQRLDHTVEDYVQGEVCKYHCARAAKAVVNDVMEMIGGASYSRAKPFERHMRDVFSGTFFPQNKFTALELIGKHLFGVDWSTEPRFT